ncbi:MAG: NAD(P)H:quinone oxidoreductase [Chloroflexota bacterium]
MRVLIVFFSRNGHTARLAEAIAEGARSVKGADVVLRRVDDLAPAEVIASNAAWKKSHDELTAKYQQPKVEELAEADAIIFGTPTRYGNMAAELKLFIDRTGPQWMQGTFVGKIGSVFCTNSTIHSGNESTLLTMMVPLLHHGMIIVGVPQTVPETATAGSYYGASATTGANPNAPTPDDLKVGHIQGQRVAEITAQLLRGKDK